MPDGAKSDGREKYGHPPRTAVLGFRMLATGKRTRERGGTGEEQSEAETHRQPLREFKRSARYAGKTQVTRIHGETQHGSI